MKEEDFKECRFIEDNMKFYTYRDFLNFKFIIRRDFNYLSDNAKIFYKYYVYANIHITENQKNKIWDFLNGYDDGSELLKAINF